MAQNTDNKISVPVLSLFLAFLGCQVTLIFQIAGVSGKFGSLIAEVAHLQKGLSELRQTVSDEAKRHEVHVLKFQEELLKLDGEVKLLKSKVSTL